jgi:hypothetical protein
MQTIAKSMGVAAQTGHGSLIKTMPDPVPKPPGRPPGELIIIKDPFRPLEAPELDGSLEEEEEENPKIKRPPITPEMPPPPEPWEYADWHR